MMATKRRKAEKLHRKSPGRRSSRRKDAEDGESACDKSRAEASEIPGEQRSTSPGISRGASSYKTPKRTLVSKSRLPTFSSPGNEADLQQEIFWDPNSPTACKLGNYQKKQTVSGHMVEISEIVNRIAPQDEKPACNENSLLGLWIGDDAIPCTPGITTVRSRTKINGPRRLRLKNKEEELMKLAKQFDQNFTDTAQDQDASCCLTAEAKVSVEVQGEVKMEDQQLVSDYPKPDVTLPNQGFNQSAMTVEEHCANSQKSMDPEAECALNALFDGPTQKCSRRLSQSLSDCPSDNSFHESQGTLLEAENTLDKILPAHRFMNKYIHLGKDSTPVVESSVSILAKEPKPTSEPTTGPVAVFVTEAGGSSDCEGVPDNDFDDWESDLLPDDSFLMQITQNPELIATPKTVLGCASSENGGKSEKTANSRKLDSAQCAFNLPVSDALQKESIQTRTTKPISLDNDGHLKNDKISSISKSSQNKTYGSPFVSVNSENKNVQEGFTQLKCATSTNFPEKKTAPGLLPSNPSKPQTEKYKSNLQSVSHQSPIVSPITKAHAFREVTHQASTSKGHPKQTEVLKKSIFSSDDWNEPRFSDEILGLFCESTSLWGTNCEDDDLFYQICGDVEKNTQSQDHGKENEKAKLVVGNISTLKPSPCLSEPLQEHYNFPQAPKHHMGRKTFSLDAPVAGTVLVKKEELADSFLQHSCVTFKAERINSILGKPCRSSSVPAGGFVSVMDTDTLSSASLNINNIQGQNGFCNVNKLQNNCSINQLTIEKPKYAFRKTNSSQAIVLEHKNVNSTSCARINPELVGSKDLPNVTLQTSVNTEPFFKRHHSDGFSQIETEQKSRKCSQEEIARKKQEALQRRKYKMQYKNTAPT